MKLYIRECGSTVYVGMAQGVSFSLCRLEGAVWMAKSVGTLVKRETTLKGIKVC